MLEVALLTERTIRFRLVEISDAEFILGLRINPTLNEHLSETPPDIEHQRAWLAGYKAGEADNKQYYFIIERHDGVACGAVRLYDFLRESFCWGSWILNSDKTRYAAIESALLVYRAGFDMLGYPSCHFDVRKQNHRVISFHLRTGAEIIREDAENYYFILPRDVFNRKKDQLARWVNER